MATTTKRRVTIVDDDDLSRRGMMQILLEDDRFEVVAALTHDEALNAEDGGWLEAEVVVVDVADERRRDDHFPGVAVVERIRACRESDETVVIVMTSQFFNDAVRWRMREARADLFFRRQELQDAARLREVLYEPLAVSRAVPALSDPETAFRHGVTDTTRVNEAVRYAARVEWLDDGIEQPAGSRRAFGALRGDFGRESRLHPRNTDGSIPDREQQHPSKTQIRRFLDWATRVSR